MRNCALTMYFLILRDHSNTCVLSVATETDVKGAVSNSNPQRVVRYENALFLLDNWVTLVLVCMFA